MTKRTLPQVPAEPGGLGLPSIMSPALAARFGAPYISLAVCLIDIDRMRLGLETVPFIELPFGWEVWVTRRLLETRVDPSEAETLKLVEAMAVFALERASEGDCLGSQALFAIYELVQAERWPKSLASLFGEWLEPPREVLGAVAVIEGDSVEQERILRDCLSLELDPPVQELTFEAIRSLF